MQSDVRTESVQSKELAHRHTGVARSRAFQERAARIRFEQSFVDRHLGLDGLHVAFPVFRLAELLERSKFR